MEKFFDMTEKTIGTDINQVQITDLDHLKIGSGIKELLKVNLDAYFQNRAKDDGNASFGPVMLVGPSGTGKTITAKAIHHELANLCLIETNGEMMNNAAELNSIIITADKETTIFIDECQALKSKAQHILLTALSERKIYVRSSSNQKIKFAIPLSNFELILSSTHEFQLQDALRNRMRIYCRFDYYSIAELIEIVKQRVDALQWKYESEEVLSEIAQRAKQTPRLALNRNLQMAWNVATSQDRDVITLDDVKQAFRLLQIDALGLDSLERAYLKELSKHKSMRLNVIASKIGLPRQTISTVIEPFLLREELIEKKNSDRVITAKGREHTNNTVL